MRSPGLNVVALTLDSDFQAAFGEVPGLLSFPRAESR